MIKFVLMHLNNILCKEVHVHTHTFTFVSIAGHFFVAYSKIVNVYIISVSQVPPAGAGAPSPIPFNFYTDDRVCPLIEG